MPVFILIFLLLLIAYAILIDYYRRAWNKLPYFNADHSNASTLISVIVPVRNEEKNINKLLASLAAQSYPVNLFEIIIVDDHSDDATWQLLQDYKSSPNFSSIRLADHVQENERLIAHKKKAIETGISASKGQLIVTSDADCVFHTDWLKTIESFYLANNAKFIAAPVKIITNKTILSYFQTLDFITLQGITAASVYKRIHSMCNGANLAYEKQAFIDVDGFSGIDNIPSGDDMLLMHKIYKQNPDKVFYLKNKEAIVSTTAMDSWKSFFNQRIRWASKATSYDDKRIFYVLLLVYLLNCCYLALTIISFFQPVGFFFLLLLILAKVLIEFPFVNSVAAFFGQQRLMSFFILFQPIHIIYTIIAGWLGKFGSFEWKERKIKTT